MTKPHLPFLVFFALLMLTIPCTFDVSTSVVPGWHTTIYPPFFIGGIAIAFVLLLVTIGYWQLSKQVQKFNLTIFAIHFILTIPTIINIKFPFALIDLQLTNQEELIKSLSFRENLTSVSWVLFIVGQILFLIYYVKTIKEIRS